MNYDFSKNNKAKSTQATADVLSLLSGNYTSKGIQSLPISSLTSFLVNGRTQPFKVEDDKAMDELTENIREYGIQSPVLVRQNAEPDEDTYMIISGHRRTHAAGKAGLKYVPCIVIDCDDRTAEMLMVHMNFQQRQKLLPSERAWGYAVNLDAHNCSTRKLADILQTQAKEIQRYVRLTQLAPTILEMVDSGELRFVAGYHLSFLNVDNQFAVVNFMLQNSIAKKLTDKLGYKLRDEYKHQISKKGKDFVLSEDILFSLFSDVITSAEKSTLQVELKRYIPADISVAVSDRAVLQLIERHKDELAKLIANYNK